MSPILNSVVIPVLAGGKSATTGDVVQGDSGGTGEPVHTPSATIGLSDINIVNREEEAKSTPEDDVKLTENAEIQWYLKWAERIFSIQSVKVMAVTVANSGDNIAVR